MKRSARVARLDVKTSGFVAASHRITSLSVALEELVLNSLDSGSRHIDVSLDTLGWNLRVQDDGCGINVSHADVIGEPLHSSSLGCTPGEAALHAVVVDRPVPFGSRGLSLASMAQIATVELASTFIDDMGMNVTWGVSISSSGTIRRRLTDLQAARMMLQSPLLNDPATVKSASANASVSTLLHVQQQRSDSCNEGNPLLRRHTSDARSGTVVCLRDIFGSLPVRRKAVHLSEEVGRCIALVSAYAAWYYTASWVLRVASTSTSIGTSTAGASTGSSVPVGDSRGVSGEAGVSYLQQLPVAIQVDGAATRSDRCAQLFTDSTVDIIGELPVACMPGDSLETTGSAAATAPPPSYRIEGVAAFLRGAKGNMHLLFLNGRLLHKPRQLQKQLDDMVVAALARFTSATQRAQYGALLPSSRSSVGSRRDTSDSRSPHPDGVLCVLSIGYEQPAGMHPSLPPGAKSSKLTSTQLLMPQVAWDPSGTIVHWPNEPLLLQQLQRGIAALFSISESSSPSLQAVGAYADAVATAGVGSDARTMNALTPEAEAPVEGDRTGYKLWLRQYAADATSSVTSTSSPTAVSESEMEGDGVVCGYAVSKSTLDVVASFAATSSYGRSRGVEPLHVAEFSMHAECDDLLFPPVAISSDAYYAMAVPSGTDSWSESIGLPITVSAPPLSHRVGLQMPPRGELTSRFFAHSKMQGHTSGATSSSAGKSCNSLLSMAEGARFVPSLTRLQPTSTTASSTGGYGGATRSGTWAATARRATQASNATFPNIREGLSSAGTTTNGAVQVVDKLDVCDLHTQAEAYTHSYHTSAFCHGLKLERQLLQHLTVIGQLDRKFIVCVGMDTPLTRSFAGCTSSAGSSTNGASDTSHSNYAAAAGDTISDRGTLFLIDQHAADERIRLEQSLRSLFGVAGTALRNALEELSLAVETADLSGQALALEEFRVFSPPTRLRLTPQRMALVRTIAPVLELWGFVCRPAQVTEAGAPTSSGGCGGASASGGVGCFVGSDAAAVVASRRTMDPALTPTTMTTLAFARQVRLAPQPCSSPSSTRSSESPSRSLAHFNVVEVCSLPCYLTVAIDVTDMLQFIDELAAANGGGYALEQLSHFDSGSVEGRRRARAHLFHAGYFPPALTRVVNSKACRGAIMFGDELTIPQCREVLDKLQQCSLPFQCAHGRPSLIPLVSYTYTS